MRLLLIAWLAVLPGLANAGLAEHILQRIEKSLLYPYTKARMQPGKAAQFGMQATMLKVPGARVLVWHRPPAQPGGPVVLYFHGNAGTLEVRGWRFEAFAAQGFGIVAPSLRGGAGSSGTPSEPALIEDARAVYHALATLVPGYDPRSAIVYGESLGAAIALGLMDALPHDQRPAGVVLEAPFTSIPEMARATLDQHERLVPHIQDTWSSLERASALTTPLLILHGSEDAVTPVQMGRDLFAAAATQEKDLHIVTGAGHANTWTRGTQRRLWRFVRSYSAAAAR